MRYGWEIAPDTGYIASQHGPTLYGGLCANKKVWQDAGTGAATLAILPKSFAGQEKRRAHQVSNTHFKRRQCFIQHSIIVKTDGQFGINNRVDDNSATIKGDIQLGL